MDQTQEMVIESTPIPNAKEKWRSRAIDFYSRRGRLFLSDDILYGGKDSIRIIPNNNISDQTVLDVFIPKNAVPPDSPPEETSLKIKYPGSNRNAVDISGRSRFTQPGLETLELKLSPYELMTEGDRGKHPNMVRGKLVVKNFGRRTIEIRENDGIARIFSTLGADSLKGDDLIHWLGNELKISGQQGVDWKLVDAENREIDPENEKDREKAVAIKFKISNRYALLHKRSPISPTGPLAENLGYRKYLHKKVFRTIDDLKKTEDYWNAETVPVYMGEGMYGVIDPEVEIGSTNDKKPAYHLYSRFVEGGKTDWPIKVEVYTGDLDTNDLNYSDTWVKIRFYQHYVDSSRTPVDDTDPKIIALHKAAEFLNKHQTGKEPFTEGPWVVNFVTGSEGKEIIALESMEKSGIIPIISIEDPGKSLYQPLEYDPRFGKLDLQSASVGRKRYRWLAFLDAVRRNKNLSENEYENEIKARLQQFPQGESFLQLSLPEKAEEQAKLKALQSVDVSPNNMHFLATDQMAEVKMPNGTSYALTKMVTKEEQLEALEKITQAGGIIYGSVGIAYGELISAKFPIVDLTERFSDVNLGTIRTSYVNFRVNLSLTQEKIDEYLRLGSQEISKSGMVIDAFGKYGAPLVQSIEIEDPDKPGNYILIDKERAKDIVLGYPVDAISKLIKSNYPNGNYADREELKRQISKARQNITKVIGIIRRKT